MSIMSTSPAVWRVRLMSDERIEQRIDEVWDVIDYAIETGDADLERAMQDELYLLDDEQDRRLWDNAVNENYWREILRGLDEQYSRA